MIELYSWENEHTHIDIDIDACARNVKHNDEIDVMALHK